MALFFFLSGIFSRVVLQRKGPKAFMKDKLYRFMLPAVVYTVVASPEHQEALDLFMEGQAPTTAIVENHLRDLSYSPGIRGPVWYFGFAMHIRLL
jgi:hypothetical protein